jgi:hypothetical protein
VLLLDISVANPQQNIARENSNPTRPSPFVPTVADVTEISLGHKWLRVIHQSTETISKYTIMTMQWCIMFQQEPYDSVFFFPDMPAALVLQSFTVPIVNFFD